MSYDETCGPQTHIVNCSLFFSWERDGGMKGCRLFSVVIIFVEDPDLMSDVSELLRRLSDRVLYC